MHPLFVLEIDYWSLGIDNWAEKHWALVISHCEFEE